MAIGPNHGRMFVAQAQNGTQGMEFANLCRNDLLAGTLAQQLSNLRHILEPVAPKVIREDRMIGDRFIHHAFVNLSPFDLVACEQGCSSPTLQACGQFPAKVYRVSYTHVHAIAPEGRMKMASISCQKGSTGGIFVRQQSACDPLVLAKNVIWQI